MPSEAFQLPDDYQTALDQGWLPIRDVARQTGVNAVTLRAWERRYGLIVPGRTPKGHRLYNSEHVARIQAILTWLNRGVAVSQVNELLNSRSAAPQPQASQWSEQRQQLLEAVLQLSERQLDDLFNRNLALYPPRTLCEQLLLPLLSELEQRWQGQFGSQLEWVFFHSWLRSKLGARLYHNNRQHSGAPLLLLNLSSLPLEAGLWLSAWLASSADCPVEVFDWPVPLGELSLALEQLKPRAVLLYSSQSLDSSVLRKQLPRLASTSAIPLLLAGPAARIHHDELHDMPGLSLAVTPPNALHTLQQNQPFPGAVQ